MPRLILASLLVFGCASVGLSEELLREISWAELKAAGQLPEGEILPGQPPAPAEQLRIENHQDGPQTVTLLVLDDPGITQAQYAVTGQVRYEGVQGRGYLELWSHFPDGSRAFSRTLGRSGLLQDLEGSSAWRPFSLPFLLAGRTDRPTRLVVNVVLPGRGTVYLGPLRLVQYADDQDPLCVAGQWWGDQTAGVVGGILGSVLGCLGALVGTLSGMGKARRLVLTLMGTTAVAGLVSLGVGAVALISGQPYAVWFPLLLVGALSVAIMGGSLPVVRRRYAEIELRRMAAADASLPGAPDRNPVL
jgi:hypothetical protein